MTERDIFLALLDIPDRDERTSFLEEACAGHPELRAGVEELLAAHEKSGRFLNAADDPDRTMDSAGQSDLGFLDPPTKPGSLGRLGHYEILGVLGRGGFGIVFKAFDDTLHRIVAIKAMAPHLAATSPPRKRFLGEARAVAAIKHENVVSVFAVEEKPIPYLVMEFVAGDTLQSHLDRTGPLELSEMISISKQIAKGLDAAHTTGLIHRDIKPANILLEAGPELKVKLTDFGLARAADDAQQAQSGAICGTPMYMSPEQAQGKPLDVRSDLFSLGSVMYVMASGRPPFRAESTLAVMKRLVEDTPRPIREIVPKVPEWLCRVIGTLQAKNPSDRYGSAKEVVAALDGGESAAPRVAKPRFRWAAAAAILLPILAGAFVVSQKWWKKDEAPVENPPVVAGKDDPKPPVKTTSDRSVRYAVGGAWHLENGELVQPKTERSIIHFGDPNWTDYTLEVEGRSKSGVKGGQGPMVLFRVEDPSNFREFVIGAYGGTATEATFHTNGLWARVPGSFLQVPHEHDRWYKIRIEARGGNITCSVDGKPVFTHAGAAHRRGMIGLATWNSSIRYRNLKVTAPDGTVLWEGFPDVGSPPPSPDVERRALDWVLSVGGSLVIQNAGGTRRLKAGDSIPDGAFEVRELSLLDVATVDDASIETLKAVPNVTGHLYLMNNPKLGDAGLAKLASYPGLSGITQLTLTGTHAVTEAGFRYINAFPKLTSLALGGPGVTDATLETVVRKRPDLRKLQLSGPFTARGLVTLGELKLEKLDLYECPNLEDAAAIAASLPIEHLGLSFTPVSDSGLERLAKSKTLRTVTFRGCNVRSESLKRPLMTDAGLRKLAAARPDIRIESDGKAIDSTTSEPDRRAAEFVLKIRERHLIQVQVNDDGNWIGLNQLPTGPFRLTSVLAESAKTLDDAGLANFAGCRNIKSLRIWDSPVTEKGLAHFADCRDLETLQLKSDTITDAALNVFAGCDKLTRIDIESKSISDEGMTAFQGRKLKALMLSQTNITDRTLDLFPDCPDLKWLWLSATRISDAGLKNFSKSKQIGLLKLANTRITDEGLAVFAGCKKLGDLDLNSCPGVTDAGLANFRDCRDLEEIDLGQMPQITNAGLAHLSECKRLLNLYLQGTSVTDDGLKVLRGFKALRLLNLSGTRISAAALGHFKECASLWTLDLSNTKLGDEAVDAIASISALKTVKLADTRITAEGRKRLKALLPNAKIE
jgi:serine/threonine protein kinase